MLDFDPVVCFGRVLPWTSIIPTYKAIRFRRPGGLFLLSCGRRCFVARGAGVSIMRTHHPNWLLIVAILLISTMTLYAQRQKHWR
jgi:hypothetical protein